MIIKEDIMSEERNQILKMLSEGKIEVSEAERLLDAINQTPEKTEPAETTDEKTELKYLRVQVDPKGNGKDERVDIRIPLQLVRAGAKIASFLPNEARAKIDGSLKDKGVDFSLSEINRGNVDELLDALREMSIDVDSGVESVRIFCE
jgi:DNA-binding transcriptional ArsR family regulator